MAAVRVEPSGLEIVVPIGKTLFEAAFAQGVQWPTRCYGQARCTRCHVRILGDEDAVIPIDSEEEA
jgi:ferredoxin